MTDQGTQASDLLSTPTAVGAVALKLPPFRPLDPEAWFADIENEFFLRRITDDATMFSYVRSVLDPTVSTRIFHELQSLPSGGKYKGIKEVILDVYGLSDEERVHQLVNEQFRDGERPSDLYARMARLAKEEASGKIVRHLFLGKLPTIVRSLMPDRDSAPITDLAKRADQIWRSERNGIETSVMINRAVSSTKTTAAKNGGQTSTESNYAKRRELGWCYYHSRFADRATKCRSPCKYNSSAENEVAGSR